MRTLLWMPSATHIPGGHLVQMARTAEALRALSVDCAVESSPNAELDGIDVVHGFGLNRRQVRAARASGAVVALSTIYWSLDYTQDQREWATRLRVGSALLRDSLRGRYRAKCQSLMQRREEVVVSYEMADMLLPNSRGEATKISRELGVTTPMHVVPNAVDHHKFTPASIDSKRPVDVLYVGRFEPHKNQLGLIRALRGTKWSALLAGAPHPDHPGYLEQCRREAGPNIRIHVACPQLSHVVLPDVYRSARVHVLPSWYETTGLVSLEAALCGCNVVTTDRGYAREYFGELAWYCDPADHESIRRAIQAGLSTPYRAGLATRIVNQYTWAHTGRATLDAYRMVCGANEAVAV